MKLNPNKHTKPQKELQWRVQLGFRSSAEVFHGAFALGSRVLGLWGLAAYGFRMVV